MKQEELETVIVPIPPDLFPIKREEKRNSTGKAKARISPSLSNSSEKPIPNYLRPSTGSCHDFCKYGRKHAFEIKERRPLRRRIYSTNEILGDNHNQEKVPVIGNRRKREIQKQKTEEPTNMMEKTASSPQNSISSADELRRDLSSINEMNPLVINKNIVTEELIISNQAEEFIEEPTIIELETPPDLASSNESGSGENSPANKAGEFPGELLFMEDMMLETTPSASVQKCIVDTNDGPLKQSEEEFKGPQSITRRKTTSIKKGITSTKGKDTGSKQIKARTLNASDLRRGAARPKNDTTVKAKVTRQKETDESVKPNTIIKQKTTLRITSPRAPTRVRENSPSSSVARILKPKTSSLPSKKSDKSTRATTLRITSPRPPTVIKQKKPSSGVVRILKPKTSSPSKKNEIPIRATLKPRTPPIAKSVNTISKIGERRVLRSPRASLSPKASFTSMPSIKLRSIAKNSRLASPMNIGKKELKKELENNEKHQTRKLRSSSIASNSPQKKKKDKEGMLIKTGIHHRKTEPKLMQRNNVNAKMQEAPHKLSFRRGKVITPQAENTGPRRLRFRARVSNENQNGTVPQRRSLRKRSGLGKVAEPNETIAEASTVVLRHQEQQEKKDKQGLFNVVIEETASKLVETRKSKVKALVGAFETVISLQENKDYV